MFFWTWLGWLGAAVSASIAVPAPTHQANGKWITDWLVLGRYLSSGEQEQFLKELATNRNEPAEGPTAWRDASVFLGVAPGCVASRSSVLRPFNGSS